MPRNPARRSSLETKLLALLKQACSERAFEAADHLLRALECLADESEEADMHLQSDLSCLDEGYLIIAEEFWPEPSTEPCGRDGPHKRRSH